MAKVNLSQAAKLTGKNRTTIWRHIQSGKLSSERDRDGMPFVDTSELIRVYGELKQIATDISKKKPHEATPSYEDLITMIELLRTEQLEMREQITQLSHRLTHNIEVPKPIMETKPEDDPSWPPEVKTMADMILRNEIRKKHKKKEAIN
jgi:hypothetical protein